MNTLQIAVIAVFAAMTALTFILFAADKYKAVKGKWRIPEATLLTCAFFMGGVGALFGMILCRHKTKHIKFVISVPIFAVLSVAVAVCAFLFG